MKRNVEVIESEKGHLIKYDVRDWIMSNPDKKIISISGVSYESGRDINVSTYILYEEEEKYLILEKDGI